MDTPASELAKKALEDARALHQKGDLAAAIESYARIVASEPANANAWHLKALAEHQAGRFDEAAASAARALSLGEDPARLWLAGTIAQDRERLDEAEALLARAAAAKPGWPAAHTSLGQVLLARKRFHAALESFQASLRLKRNARAANNVGIALMALERRDEARQAFEQALVIDPGYALASFNLARIHSTSDVQRALSYAQDAVKADPSLADAWLLAGDLLRRRGDSDNALRAMNMAIERAPDRAIGWTSRAAVLAEEGETSAAREEFAAAWRRFPTDLPSALGAALTLPRVYTSRDHLEQSRADYSRGLDALHEDAGKFRFNDADEALVAARWTNFYLAYQGHDDRRLQQSYASFQRRVLEAAAPAFFVPRPKPPGRDRIRVGFFSHYFYNCVAGRYFSSWVTGLDRTRFETFVYYTNHWIGNQTREIAAASDTFRHLAGRSLAGMPQQVIDDGLDILVFPELGMHPDTLSLAAMRLAPVQCAAWGHPTTTGSAEIDWFISCEAMEPPGAQAHYSEKLALLPGLGTHYAAPALLDRPDRADFGLPNDRTLYLVPQSLFKIHPDNDALIAEVLARDDRAIAVLFDAGQRAVTQAFKARLGQAFQRAGIALEERARFLPGNLQHHMYLGLNSICDVMLDTLHWSGGNTSLDAIASGLPIVTLPGELMRGRQSQAMLRILGVGDLVASDRAEYVEKALALGSDMALRGDFSRRMAQSRGALFARDEPIRALEAFLERAVRG